MVSITAGTTHTMKKKPSATASNKTRSAGGVTKKSAARRASVAPKLKPVALATPDAIAALAQKSKQEQINMLEQLFHKAVGEESVALHLAAPHAASTTRDRGAAAADVAVAAKELGVTFVLKECGIVDNMQRLLFPQGIEAIFAAREAAERAASSGMSSLKPSASAVSLTSLDDMTSVATTAGNSKGTDSKRGKMTPANAREGCLLLIRALCEIVGKAAEPFLVGAFLAAALDECGSSSSTVREAAEDTTTAIVTLAHPWAFPSLICPLLLQSLHTSEWRVKAAVLERLSQCATRTSPTQVQKLIPQLIPAITDQVWDTKAQVSKAARVALTDICMTNMNQDIQPTIPAIVNAICKPADTNKAVSDLMGTTFVVPVDASTLAILCPILARALKDKLAQHKRAACVVISNMSKLVVSPQDVAPFGSLLVPELQKVAQNVQFDEIRDEALKALNNLTKALGDLYSSSASQPQDGDDVNAQQAQDMFKKQEAVQAEQDRIEKQREEEQKKEQELKEKEEEERRRFKEAMDAQRRLDELAAIEAQKKRKEEENEREKLKLSTKNSTGKCQACGLKRCKKSCMFYSG